MIAVLSSGIIKIPSLAELLGEEVVHVSPLKLFAAGAITSVAGWGRRPTAERARNFAQRHGISAYLSLEDGFLRSIELGADTPPLSVVVDDLGIYYDATTASRLEALIDAPHAETQLARARQLVQAWRSAGVSKYNHQRDFDWGACAWAAAKDGIPQEPYVLVADQTLGDVSIQYGLAETASFHRMLEAALAENPGVKVVLKVHPDVVAGHKEGHFDLAALASHPNLVVLGEDVHPASLIRHAQAVYVVTSQMGFEGLLWGKRVHTFGMPFYAGWGLTEDALPSPSRRRRVTLEDLVHAALIEYPRYLDPESGCRCEPERLIEWMGLQRRMRTRFARELFAVGISRWKMPIVSDFFQGSTVRFVEQADEVPAGAGLIVWGKKPIPGTVAEGVSLIRLEDGFLRSVGLGANFIRPLSWVVDDVGIYYDATTPSRLEDILRTTEFDAGLLDRAAALRTAICSSGITKYNVGRGEWRRPADARRVILVPGQVETDSSIQFGAPGIRHNMDLLQAVRSANPDAYVLYKQHPDVRASLRDPGLNESRARELCDEMVDDVPMERLLNEVDEVHVLTSLAGFEALLRGRRVVCYGQPFYSGWGLTEDICPHPRRQRRLSLDALVAAALILYPTYVSRVTGRFTTAETALSELQAWRLAAPVRLPLWRRIVARLLRKK